MLHNYRIRARQTFGDDAPEKWRPLFAAVVGLMRDASGKKTKVHIYSRHNEFSDLLDSIPAAPAEPDDAQREDPLAEFEPTNGTPDDGKPEGSGG